MIKNNYFKKLTKKSFIKFIIVGIFNTFLTYCLYIVLLYILSYKIAYTMSYLLGIWISYFLNSFFVFKANINFKKFLKYPIVYIVQYILNIIFLYIFVELLNINDKIAPIILIVISIPVTFTLSKIILKK